MRHYKRKMKGRGIMSFNKKAAGFLKRNKVISSVANFAARNLPSQYAGIASKIGSTAGALGYGRRRHRHGRGLRLSGHH